MWTSHLLPSRLYCRFRSHTGSCLTARGLYRRSGITPCPEDIRIIAVYFTFDKYYFTVYTVGRYRWEGCMSDKNTICSFTGHRPVKLPWGTNENDPRCISLKEQIHAAVLGIYESGYKHFICGMAIGCDTYFADEVLRMKTIYPDIILEAAIPCDNQAERWSRKQQQRYHDLIGQCDIVTYISHAYTPSCMMRRNEYMIDSSSLLLACFNGQSSGTMKTILYAERSGIKTIILDIER